jgi:putative chitinase
MAIILTADALRRIYTRAPLPVLEAFVAGQGAYHAAGITKTRKRLADNLAQLGHESGGLTRREENLNYSAQRLTEVWPGRFPDIASAQPFAKNPQALARRVYSARMGNRPGTDDGWTFRGRGPLQLTGRENYTKIGKLAGLPLAEKPDLAGMPEHAAAIVAAYWTLNDLCAFSDRDDFAGLTKRINGIKDTPFTIEELRKRAAQESDIAAATAKGLAKAPPPPDIEPTDPNPAPSGWLASFLSFLRRY